jgi:putative flippase GtrA
LGTLLHPVKQLNALARAHLTPELIRYLVMAVILVGVEIVTFQAMIWLSISYLIATPVSMLIAIVLNWYFSQKLVFNHRPHRPAKEFTLVFIASVIGIGLQLAVTASVVELGHMLPIVGKLLAICVTFFWNFWFRKKYIFFDPEAPLTP